MIDQVRGETNVDKLKKELQRLEGYCQQELMSFVPWGMNIRDKFGRWGELRFAYMLSEADAAEVS